MPEDQNQFIQSAEREEDELEYYSFICNCFTHESTN
jgi:hypothetical protein